MKIGLRKCFFFRCQGIFYMNFDFKNGCENEFKDNNKNNGADPEIGYLTKSISKLNGYATAMPTAWELVIISV